MPDPLLATYATSADLAQYWRPLSAAEQARATVLLGYAAQDINDVPGALEFTEAACKRVSLDMVKRAMMGGGGVTASTVSQEMADMSASTTDRYVNPVGNLYLTSADLRRLIGPTPPTGSIKPTNNARVPCQVWNNQPSSQTDDGAA